MQIIPLNLDPVLLLLHNSKLAYSHIAKASILPWPWLSASTNGLDGLIVMLTLLVFSHLILARHLILSRMT